MRSGTIEITKSRRKVKLSAPNENVLLFVLEKVNKGVIDFTDCGVIELATRWHNNVWLLARGGRAALIINS